MGKRRRSNKPKLPTTVPQVDLPPVPGVSISNPGAMAKSTAKAQALPQINQIKRNKKQARRDTRKGIRITNRSYGALDKTLEDIMGDYGGLYNEGLGGYNAAIAGLGPLFGGAGPIGEMSAAATQAGTMTTGAQGLMANQYATALNSGKAVREGSAVERKNTVQNYLTNLQEVIKEMNNRMLDVRAEQGANEASYRAQYQSDLFSQRMQRYEALLAQAQMQGDTALAQVLLDAINREYGSAGGGGGGGGYISRISQGVDKQGNSLVGSADSGVGLGNTSSYYKPQYQGSQGYGFQTMTDQQLAAIANDYTNGIEMVQAAIAELQRRQSGG